MASVFGRYGLPGDELVARLIPTITMSTEDPEYPGTNLTDPNPANPARMTATTGWIVFDFGEPVNAELIALIYHNLDPGLACVLEWNTSDSWGAPAGSEAITIPAWTEEPLDGAVSPWALLTGTPTFQFWRLSIGASGPANSLAISIGNVMLMGALRDLTNDARWGVQEMEDFGLLEQETELGVEHIENLEGKRRRFAGEFALMDDTAAELISLYRSATGRLSRWLLIPDVDVNDAWLVRFEGPGWARTREMIEHNIFPYTVREVSRGITFP